jgi:hypothetical protein
MDWLAQNWFWVALVGVFIGIHVFGHGGCGGHGGHEAHRAPDDGSSDKPQAHQH